MKEAELRQHAECSLCNEPIGSTGLPYFWTAEIAWHGLDAKAITRQDGLSALVGSPALAAVMGPNEEMTNTLMPAVTLTMCHNCAIEQAVTSAALQKHEKCSEVAERVAS